MISAACPKCNIILMEAKGGISDFEAAEAEAVTLGATILSNSWICYGSSDCGDHELPELLQHAGYRVSRVDPATPATTTSAARRHSTA